MTAELTIQIPDVHLPYEDKHAIRAVLDMVRNVQPTRVIQSGDLLDCKAPARWSKGRVEEYVGGLQREATAGIQFWEELRAAAPDATLVWVEGNHEARLRNYATTYAPALIDIIPTWPELMKLSDFGVEAVDQPYRVAPGVICIHGKLLDSKAPYSARKEMLRHGKSVIQSHTHRMGVGYDTTDRQRFWMEAGWLGDIKQASYLDFGGVANWQQAFGYLWIDAGRSTPGVVPVFPGGRFTFLGHSYNGRDKT